jgi:hypothetical protein
LKKRTKKLLFLAPQSTVLTLYKRNQAGHGLDRATVAETKFFCFFSSEKKTIVPYRVGRGGVTL